MLHFLWKSHNLPETTYRYTHEVQFAHFFKEYRTQGVAGFCLVAETVEGPDVDFGLSPSSLLRLTKCHGHRPHTVVCETCERAERYVSVVVVGFDELVRSLKGKCYRKYISRGTKLEAMHNNN